LRGYPKEILSDAINELNPDFAVVGSRGMTGLGR